MGFVHSNMFGYTIHALQKDSAQGSQNNQLVSLRQSSVLLITYLLSFEKKNLITIKVIFGRWDVYYMNFAH